jgi:hypothetical protein
VLRPGNLTHGWLNYVHRIFLSRCLVPRLIHADVN